MHSRFFQAMSLGGGECICPVNPEETGLPTREEFVRAYRNTVEILAAQGKVSFITGVDKVVEVDTIACSAEVSLESTNVALNVTGDPNGIPGQEQIALEKGLARAYNDLAEKSCDNLFRTVENATLELVL
jgi:hypothetical protein